MPRNYELAHNTIIHFINLNLNCNQREKTNKIESTNELEGKTDQLFD